MFKRPFSVSRSRFTPALVITLMTAASGALHAESKVQSLQSPAEMLLDAFEAQSDRRADIARSLFEQVILSYPDSKEAERATQELARLVGSPVRTEAAAPLSSDPQTYDVRAAAQDEPSSREEPPRRVRSIAELRKDFLLATGDRVFFPANSATVGARAKAMLENQARWLQLRPELEIQIIGRADDDVAPEDALDLSQKRADAVREHFIALGIGSGRIKAVGRGDRDPVATCRTDDCKLQNRLAETLLVEQNGEPNQITGSRALRGSGGGDDDVPLQQGAAASGTADEVSRPETIAR